MFLAGLVMFYSIETGQIEPELRLIKNSGTFIGLSGIGVGLQGFCYTWLTEINHRCKKILKQENNLVYSVTTKL